MLVISFMSNDAIIQKIDEYRNDIVMLDSVWTLYGCLMETPKSGFRKDNWKVSDDFIRYFCIALERNLRLKHDLKKKDVKNVVTDLYDLMELIRYDIYYDAVNALARALQNTVNVMGESAIRKLDMHKLSKLDKEILSYMFGILKNKKKKELGIFLGGESIIDFSYWDDFFNYLFNRSLKSPKIRVKISKGKLVNRWIRYFEKSFGIVANVRELTFSKAFDTIVKFGLGYWIIGISSAANPYMYLLVPNFTFDIFEKLNITPIKIDVKTQQEFERYRKRLIRQKEIEALLSDTEVEDVEEYTHDDIVRAICLNPELIESSLRILGYEYQTNAGVIDILATDSNGNYVVIEVKTGKAGHDAVGQIQKYMV